MSEPVFFSLCEALLFSTAEPVSEDIIMRIAAEHLHDNEVHLFADFVDCFNRTRSGLQLIKLAGGWQIVTRSEFSDAVRSMKSTSQRARFSKATLEALAIVAYRQPITAPEIESIRGVESSGILRNLLEKKLVKVLGRKRSPGNPLIYGTTPQFLMVFGLEDLQSLPSLEEFERILKPSETPHTELPFPCATETDAAMHQECSNEKES